MSRRGELLGESFTVRRVSFGVGVERIFPVHSPMISSIDVVSEGPRPARQAELSARTQGQGRTHQARRPQAGSCCRCRRVVANPIPRNLIEKCFGPPGVSGAGFCFSEHLRSNLSIAPRSIARACAKIRRRWVGFAAHATSARRASTDGCASPGWTKQGAARSSGPVVAAAVILNPRRRIVGLDDSKKLAPERRGELAVRIRRARACVGRGRDRLEPHRCLEHLPGQPPGDGRRHLADRSLSRLSSARRHRTRSSDRAESADSRRRALRVDCGRVDSGKVERDRRMEEFDQLYPQYGLAQNKGYGTPDHLEALRRHGPSPLHRYSYAPVREARCWAAGAEQAPLPLEAAADRAGSALADSTP